MTVIAIPETPELTDPIAEAIQAHLNNPNIPVTRIVKDFKVSRATFYRRLKASQSVSVSGLSSQAVVTSVVECPEGCGTVFPEGWSDELVLNHWVHDCKTVSWIIKRDARKLLSTAKSASAFRKAEESCLSESTSQNASLSKCVDTSQDTMIPGLPSTTDTTDTAGRISVESTTPLNESSPAPNSLNDSTDWFYQWKFDGNGNVREGWSYANLLEWYWRDVKPFGTRGCHSVTHR